jgi:KAP family P-loop domain
MILTDNETRVDLLNNEAIAITIVKLLQEKPDHPVTVGVHGDWGAGKSSVLEMIDAALESEKDVLCLKFNGWRFQGFEDAKIALIEGIVTGLVEKRPMLTKATAAVKDVFHRIDWLKVAKRAGGLALTAYTGIPTAEQVQAVVGTIKNVLADPGKIAAKENVELLTHAKDFLKDAETKRVPEEIGEFRKAFDELLKQAGVRQLVVLIDDLDRCLPETAIETLEAVRLFVFTSRTAFVVAADEAMIEYAVRKHFPELPDTTGPRDYARNYLEKLIQVPFRIPALGEAETRIYVTLLLIGHDLGEGAKGYDTLITAARERLRRPWVSGTLDAAAINTALGDAAPKAQSALALSDQIGPTLARGARGNPRQIKRFLNTLLLRKSTAEARGFGDDVKLPVLAKLMLAERFIPRLYDQIAADAAADPNGQSRDLGRLEATASSGPESDASSSINAAAGAVGSSDTTGKKPVSRVKAGVASTSVSQAPRALRESDKSSSSLMLSEWLASAPITAWATVQPPLAGIDLRPYLFIAKDRKDYFGASSALGHLAGVVEQLLGPKLSVEALAADLKRLVSPEAAQVFEAVRGRIMGGDSFESEPAGIAGLMVLVRAHPALQPNLLDFLEALPADRVGPWAVAGWGGVITESAHLTRLNELLERWGSDSLTNPVLKAAALSVQRARGGRR